MKIDIKHFYDSKTATFTYVVSDSITKKCAVIDSVMDYDMASGRTSTANADHLIDYIQKQDLILEWILETHIHADHLTAASYLQEKLGGKIGVSQKIKEVIEFWAPIFDTAQDTPSDGSQFDHLFVDGEEFLIGNLPVKVIHTPGHTPACVCYLITDNIFVGDVIFMPEMGTGRTDFPSGSARISYQSIQKILALSDQTKIFVGHDYPKQGEEPRYCCTVFEQKQHNILLNSKTSLEEYVAARNKRDFGKEVPKLLLPAIQVNLRAGGFGNPAKNGISYIKIPLNKI